MSHASSNIYMTRSCVFLLFPAPSCLATLDKMITTQKAQANTALCPLLSVHKLQLLVFIYSSTRHLSIHSYPGASAAPSLHNMRSIAHQHPLLLLYLLVAQTNTQVTQDTHTQSVPSEVRAGPPCCVDSRQPVCQRRASAAVSRHRASGIWVFRPSEPVGWSEQVCTKG